MPKENYNSKISHPNVYGRVIQHDEWLNQSVVITSEPTFASLSVTGDTTIGGNLYVMGNSSIFNTEITEFQDNILIINKAETNPGVTLNQAGIEIERGTLENARIIFNEPDDTIRIGLISGLQAVATREDSPLLDGVMLWNNSLKRLDSSNTISIPISFASTSDSAVQVNGGIKLLGQSPGIDASINMNTSNTLVLSATNDISIVPGTNRNLIIPKNIRVVFGQTNDTIQNLYVDSANSNFVLESTGDIDLKLQSNKAIKIPSDTRLTFSSSSRDSYIGNDVSNNTVLGSNMSIFITPSRGNRVVFPSGIAVTYGDNANNITGVTTGDLLINASRNVDIIPGASGSVKIPVDIPLRFGTTGSQVILSDSNNILRIASANDIHLATSRVGISAGTLLMFDNTRVNVSGSSGNLRIVAESSIFNARVVVSSTENSLAGTTLGSLRIEGGASIAKRLYSTESIQVNSTSSTGLLVGNADKNILTVSNSSTVGGVVINAGNGDTQPALLISSNAALSDNLIQFKTTTDSTNGYSLGRESRNLKINIPTYNDYSSSGSVPELDVYSGNNTKIVSINSFGITSIAATENSINANSGALIVDGGVSVKKDLVTLGRIQQSVDSSNALLIRDSQNTELLRLDSISRELSLESLVQINNTIESTSTVSGSIVTSGGAVIMKKLRVLGETTLYQKLNMNSQLISTVADPVSPQDAATKNYVDLFIQGISVKQSVTVATTSSQNLATDFFTGGVIDTYTLLTDDRILIKNQTNNIENGIYKVNGSGSPPTRTLDFITGSRASGTFVFVREGSVNKNMGFVCNSPQALDVIGTDSLAFTQFTGLGQIEAGSGLTKNFNTLDVNVDNSSLELFSDTIRIKSAGLGTGLEGGSGVVLSTKTDQSHVSKLGTIDTGVWQASVISVPYGGTGRNWYTSGNLLFGNGNSGLSTSSKLYFNDTTGNLAIGNISNTSPGSTLTITNSSMANILLHADYSETESTVYPEITLRHGSSKNGALKISRSNDQFATGIFSNSLVIQSSDALQIITNDVTRATFSSTGNIGINKNNPTSTLDVNGTFNASGNSIFYSATDSTTSSSGAVRVSGGLGVTKNMNIGESLYISGTAPSSDSSSGTLVIKSGGLSIGGDSNSGNNTNGGALSVAGGAAIKKDMYIGGNLRIDSIVNTTSPSTGAVVISGGLGVEKDMIINGDITLSETINFSNGNASLKGNTIGTLSLAVSGNTGIILGSTGITTLTGMLNISSATLASGTTSGGIVVSGGANIRGNAIIKNTLAVLDTTESSNSSIGAIIVSGGVGVSKSTTIGGDLTVSGKVRHSLNAGFLGLSNTNVSTSCWLYLGGPVSRTNVSLENLNFKLTQYGAAHSFTGGISPESHLVLYEDPSSDFHLFALVSSSSFPNLRVHSSDSIIITPVHEGTGIHPDGAVSGYNGGGGWALYYSTLSQNPSDKLNIGDIECDQIKSKDALPLFGSDYTESPARSLGSVSQLTIDEITSFPESLSNILPAQSGAGLDQVKLSAAASSSNNAYNGWFIKVIDGVAIGQVRQVKDYTGLQRVISLETPWTTQGPEEDDTIHLYNKANVSVHYTSGSFVTSFNTINDGTSLVEQTLTNLRTGGVTCGNINGEGVVLSSQLGESVASASLITQGGITAKKGLYLETGKLKIGPNLSGSDSSIYVSHNASSILLESISGSYSYLDFAEIGNSNRFGILHRGSNLFITSSTDSDTPNDSNSTTGVTITPSGYIGINCSSNIDSPLTLKSSLITTNSNDEYLGISGGRTGIGGANLILYGNSHPSSAGTLSITSTKTVIRGDVTFYGTTMSINSTTGSIVALGGLSIADTNNATSVTGGGALTVSGGLAVHKDLYVGGSIVTGSLTVIGLNSSPTITFTNTSNCSVSAYGSSSLALIGTEALLSFYVNILPINANQNTQFEFNIPSRSSVLPQRGDIASACSGWTDDTNLHVIQNILCAGIQGSTRAIIKFQSISTAMHVIQVISRYNPA